MRAKYIIGATIIVASSTLVASEKVLDVNGYLRLHHMLDGKDNNFDKESGSAFGGGIRVDAKMNSNFSGGIEYYGVTDTGLTDEDEGVNSIGYGLFMNDEKNPKKINYGDVIGLNVAVNYADIDAKVARGQLDSPLTKNQTSIVPNMYEYASIKTDISNSKLSLAYITKMAYGSRSSADFGMIGEHTDTAGMAKKPFTDKPDSVERGKYKTIDDTVSEETSNEGILLVGFEKKVGDFSFRVYDFYANDILNNLYADVDYKLGSIKGIKTTLSAQYWNQKVYNNTIDKNYGGNLYGVQAKMKWNKLIFKLSANSKDSGGIYNAWGADPAYTSSKFSRNEYRSDVDAYRVGLSYKIMKGLKLVTSYAHYSQSDMSSTFNPSIGTLQTAGDAKETDLMIVYKPKKDLTLKLFNVNRTSEFDGAITKSGKSFEATQNHTRLVVNYNF